MITLFGVYALFVSVACFLVALTLPGFWLFALARGRRSRIAQPICAVCGYHTMHLASFTCPECGTDVRIGGIATRRMRTLGGMRRFDGLGAWTGLVLIAAIIGSLFLQHLNFTTPSGKTAGRTVLAPVSALAAPVTQVVVEGTNDFGGVCSRC